MNNNDILEWTKQEFAPIQLATDDNTILQIIKNAKRYWNTHSAFPIVKMFNGTSVIQLSQDYKNVVTVYPATVPDWILGNYPLWSLLGITIIDNLTSDLVMLSEAYRNYRYYMGSDFQWHFERSNNPAIGPVLYLTNVPTNVGTFAVVGTKRIIDNVITENFSGTSGTTTFAGITPSSVILETATQTYTDDGEGNLDSSLSTGVGTINYDTGVWSVTSWSGATTGTISYEYSEDITAEHILDWLLYYVKALTKMAEGNALRKTGAINITNDGQQLMNEGQEEKKELETRLSYESRWTSFARRF